jgi:FxsC-like protein
MDFFFSYSRKNNDVYLKRFLKDLSKELSALRPANNGQEAHFFDQHHLRRGMEWKQELLDALQNARVLVCVYSPDYFLSEYCGKEWQVFQARREQAIKVAQAAGQIGVKLPPIIKPVIWVPFDGHAPSAIGPIQYKDGDPHAEVNTDGLMHIIRQFSKYKNKYWDYIRALAEEIKETVEKHDVKPLAGVLNIDAIPNAFCDAPPVPPAAHGLQSAPAGAGPETVRFVYVAGKPDELSPKRQEVVSYHHNGGKEWKPFWSPPPAHSKPIFALAQEAAIGEPPYFDNHDLPITSTLQQDVKTAEKQGQLVVLLVDSWTACLDPYKQWLRHFDEANYFNCSVIIPWNDSDTETAQKASHLEKELKQAFPFRADGALSVHYCGLIRSEDEFRRKLRDVLLQLKSKVQKNATPDPKRNIPSGASLTVISAATGGGGQ